MNKKESLRVILSDALALSEVSARGLLAEFATASGDAAGWDDDAPTPDNSIVAPGVAVVCVHGLMTKRGLWWGPGSDAIADVVDALVERRDVDHIVFDFDTGGGTVAGTERLANAVWAARQSGKNTIAVVNECCASAGLWVASQCEQIVIPSTGNIGSLGIYTIHFDDTKFLDELGFEKTVIHRGKYKATEERPLDESGRADLQRWIDLGFQQFVDAVARGRGLDPGVVIERWGDSQMFKGTEAVASGLADGVGTLQDVLTRLKAGHGGRVNVCCDPANNEPEGEPEMKVNPQGQILDASGRVVVALGDLGLAAADVETHFPVQAKAMKEAAANAAVSAINVTVETAVADSRAKSLEQLDALVAAVGPERAVAAFKAGDSVDKAKAGLADDLAAQLAAKEKELADLKAAGPSGGGPRFVPSDSKAATPPTDGAKSVDKDAPFAADWNANANNCQTDFPDLATYGAYRRNAVRPR